MSEYRPLLLVVDVQNGFVTADSAPVVPVIAELAARWLDAGGPAIFTRYFNYPGSPYERLVHWYSLHESPETDLTGEVADLAEHPMAAVADKSVYSALTDEVRQMLAGGGCTDVLVCGIATDGCVLKTVLDLFEAGLVPWVITDACASNASRVDPAEVHRSALMLMGRLVGAGQLITVADVLAMLPDGEMAR